MLPVKDTEDSNGEWITIKEEGEELWDSSQATGGTGASSAFSKARVSLPVGKTWQIFQILKFHQLSKNINKFNFPSVYSVSMGEIAFLPLKLNKQMEN